MKFSGVVQVGMVNIIANFHCKQTKEVVVLHGTTVWT